MHTTPCLLLEHFNSIVVIHVQLEWAKSCEIRICALELPKGTTYSEDYLTNSDYLTNEIHFIIGKFLSVRRDVS